MVLSEDDRKLYGGEVLRLRTVRGWTRKDLSDRSGVPEGTLQDIEASGAVPREDTLNKIFTGLGVEATTFGLLDTWLVDVLRSLAAIFADIPRERRPEAMGAVMTVLGRAARGANLPADVVPQAHVSKLEVTGNQIDITQQRTNPAE